MNILFLTMNVFTDVHMHNIYSDLMLELIARGHRPFIVTPRQKSMGIKTARTDFPTYTLLTVQTGNTAGVSLIEKGISTVTMSGCYYRAIRKHLGKEKFDLILYSTPPITLAAPVKKLKKLFHCPTYLMLKDIFPQNAVDLGMFSAGSMIYKYFRRQEKLLYRVSDRIGCMSPANVEYLLARNPEIPADKAEICPNGIIPCAVKDRHAAKTALREKYHIPETAVVYLFGGNLGRPQGIPALIECLRKCKNRKDAFFLICGSGTDALPLDDYIAQEKPENVVRSPLLPKQEYDEIAAGCDVGMVFLDPRFTIPNYPSRILSYMENSMPVLVCSDAATDMGAIAEANGFGFACSSADPEDFAKLLAAFSAADLEQMGRAARKYLENNYTASACCDTVLGVLK
ncbi:MAG: glycosyltransferase family 4 protein [Oscillospiraceae bacterium]|nr:glycosyltransferase family 4 protein [Oscillospiraceae bacterium]